MILTPQTEVHLLKGVPFVKDSGHERKFSSQSEQLAYFNSLPSKVAQGKYVENDKSYKADGIVEEFYGYNYMMFKNSNIGDKWIFAFIDKISWGGNGVTLIDFTVHPWQTFQFDLTFKESYIEREHAMDSLINTQDEEIAYGGEYRNTKIERYYPYQLGSGMGDLKFALLTTKENIIVQDEANKYVSQTMSSIQTPLHYYLVPFYDKQHNGQWFYGLSAMVNGNSSMSSLTEIYQKLATNKEYVGSVVSIQLLDYVPLDISISISEIEQGTFVPDVTCPQLRASSIAGLNNLTLARIIDNKSVNKVVASVSTLSGFPLYKWNKLYTYPYSYIEMTDNQGQSFTIKPEHLGTTLEVLARGGLSTQHKTVYNVLNYKGLALDISNAIVNNTITSLTVLEDSTAAYIRSSENSERMSIATSTFNGIVQGITAGAVAGGVGSAIGAVTGVGVSYAQSMLSLNAKKKDIDNRPPSIGSQGNNATYDYGNGNIGVYLKWWTVTEEYAQTISDYFNKLGYKVNKLKVPNLSSRRYWNYVKTVDSMIFASIPQNYLNEIKKMFDTGVTLWHTNDIGNYSLNNTEV